MVWLLSIAKMNGFIAAVDMAVAAINQRVFNVRPPRDLCRAISEHSIASFSRRNEASGLREQSSREQLHSTAM